MDFPLGCMRYYTLITLLFWQTKMDSIIFDLMMAPLWSKNLRGMSEEIIPLGMVGTVGTCLWRFVSHWVTLRLDVPCVSFPSKFWTLPSFWGPDPDILALALSDVSLPVPFAREGVAKLVMGIPRWFRWVTFLVSREAMRHSRVWGSRPFFSIW